MFPYDLIVGQVQQKENCVVSMFPCCFVSGCHPVPVADRRRLRGDCTVPDVHSSEIEIRFKFYFD